MASTGDTQPVESLVDAGCKYLSKGGELLRAADTQVGDARDSLDRGIRLAGKRNIKVIPLIISTRDFASAIIETAAKHKSLLILLGRRRCTQAEKIFFPDISAKIRKKTDRDVILLRY